MSELDASGNIVKECFAEPYVPQSCWVDCLEVGDGAQVTVTGTSSSGYTIDWNENGQVTTVAGGTDQAGSYTYATAGTYKIKICLVDPCDTLSDWEIEGGTLNGAGCCN